MRQWQQEELAMLDSESFLVVYSSLPRNQRQWLRMNIVFIVQQTEELYIHSAKLILSMLYGRGNFFLKIPRLFCALPPTPSKLLLNSTSTPPSQCTIRVFPADEMVRNAYQGIGSEYETLLKAFDRENEVFKKRVGKDRVMAVSYTHLSLSPFPARAAHTDLKYYPHPALEIYPS